MAPNGSLYLVTGCDKSFSWGVASCSSACGEGDIALKFTAANSTAGSASLGYVWETFSSASVRVHPDGNATAGTRQQNNCVFLRGFRVSVRDGLAAKFRQPVELKHVEEFKHTDILGPAKGTYRPFSGERKFSSGNSRGAPGSSPPSETSSKPDNPNIEPEIQTLKNDVQVEMFPPTLNVWISHTLTINLI
jgi:hypothetical protein